MSLRSPGAGKGHVPTCLGLEGETGHIKWHCEKARISHRADKCRHLPLCVCVCVCVCVYTPHSLQFYYFSQAIQILPPGPATQILWWKYFFFLHFSPSYFFPPTHLWYVLFRQIRVKTGQHWWDCFSQVWERKSFPMKTSVSVQVMPSYPPKEMFWLTFFWKS